jgi:CRISPR-associated protein Csd1
MQIGDSSTIFWAEKTNKLEEEFSLFFMPQKDNPDAGAKAVKALIESVDRGNINIDEEKTRFYILGLSPNAARISIRFFIQGTIWDISGKIARHFKDLEIDKPKYENEFLPMLKLLASTAVLGKPENIAPHLAGDFMISVLNGLPYPETLLQSVINRIKAEQDITYARAALIKGYLNRKARYKNQKEEITVSLNKENYNQGYVLGRLFAVLEKLQEEAQGVTNSTIMRFYGSASSSPVVVFPNLMKLHVHHLNKLSKESPGRAVNFEKLIGEIEDKINDEKCYARHLSLTDQGMFSVGYYQQRQDFF